MPPRTSPGIARQVAVVVAFVAALRLILVAAWPAMPLPQLGGMLALVVVGAVVGLLVPRLLPALGAGLVFAGATSSGSVIAGGAMGFVLGAPFAGAGVVAGLFARAAIRRRGRDARRPPRPPAVAPPARAALR